MQDLRAIPAFEQREEPWANGAGSTIVILREPNDAGWRQRISVARVEREGGFSELPGVRRTLVPLDAPMELRFADGHEDRAPRFGMLCFDGSPAPTGLLPDGPTRDFNLMLRGNARGVVIPRTLVGAMMLPGEPGMRWLAYLDSGHAVIHVGADASLALNPRDAALVSTDGDAYRALVEGHGEIVLVKLYA